jgi:large subunit ribosomal protein L6
MSKIGTQPVAIIEGVTVTVVGKIVTVKGPKGELTVLFTKKINVEVKDNQVLVSRESEFKKVKAMHGTIRSLINNAIEGVTKGYEKKLELVGTGYRVAAKGKDLTITVGFSHPVEVKAVEGIDFQVEGQNLITVSGIDKHLVGQVAASIREIKKPEPYKGKGIKYIDEHVVRKAGKAAKGAE